MRAYASVDLPEPFGPMIACFSFVLTVRSTPLTIGVPSSSETCRFLISSNPTDLSPRLVVSRQGRCGRAASPRLLVSYPDPSRSRTRVDPLLQSRHALRNRHLGAPDPPARAAPRLRPQAAAGDGSPARQGNEGVQGLGYRRLQRRRGRGGLAAGRAFRPRRTCRA